MGAKDSVANNCIQNITSKEKLKNQLMIKTQFFKKA